MLTRDRALALSVLLGTGILAVDSLNIPEPSSWQPYGSALMPQILLAVLGVLGTALLVKSFMSETASDSAFLAEVVGFVRRNTHILVLFALFGIYVFAMPRVGYLAATAGFLFAALGLLHARSGRRVLAVIVIAITVSTLIYAIFQYGLGIRLP